MKHQETVQVFLFLLLCSSIQFINSQNSDVSKPFSYYVEDNKEKVNKPKSSPTQNNNKPDLSKNKEDKNNEKGNKPQSSPTKNTKPQPDLSKYFSTSSFPTELYQKTTGWQDVGDWSINYLDRHTINCDSNYSAINSFIFEQDSKKHIRFKYSCVKAASISSKCTERKTPLSYTEFFVKKSLNTLMKHYVECPKDTVMKKFKFNSQGNFKSGIMSIFQLSEDKYPKLSITYSCCNAKIQRTILTDTSRTINSDNHLSNLRFQRVLSRDFNAISSFHMQAPAERIFFEIKIRQLEGEQSPSYPDYFKDNSMNTGVTLDISLPEDSNSSNTGNTATKPKSDVPSFVGKYKL